MCLSNYNPKSGKTVTAGDVMERMSQLQLERDAAVANGNDLFDQLNAALAVAHEAMGCELAEIQRRVNAKVALLRLERREKRFEYAAESYPPGVVPKS